jgi:hypothetical protein
MSTAFSFINIMCESFCKALNNEEKNLDFYQSNYPLGNIIENNMMKGKYFSTKKFSEFLLDKSKHDDVKLALNELEDYGVGLQYCWEYFETFYDDFSHKEKLVSYLISTKGICTFNHLFKAFEPNGLDMFNA